MEKKKTPIEAILDQLEYTPTNNQPSGSGLPYVTHEGKLKLGEIEMTVCVLNNGERIIPADELEKFFGVISSTPNPPSGTNRKKWKSHSIK